MEKATAIAALAALAMPTAAAAKNPPDAADLKRLEAKVAQQQWYPEGYYDIRIAAEAERAEAEGIATELLMDWDDGIGKRYDLVDCGAEYVNPAEVDPVTARYGDVALEVSRIRGDLEALEYPLAAYAEPLLAYEKARIEEATAAPDPMAPEEADPGAAAEFTEDYDPAKDPLQILATTIEANRLRLAPKRPPVVVEGGCGDGGGAGGVIVQTVPAQGEVLLINAFAFKVCTRKKPDPWDRFACKWTEIETGAPQDLGGHYVYQIRWPDGTVRKGTRDIHSDFDSDAATTVTFRKTGS